MYPIIRMLKEVSKYRNAPGLALNEFHVSHHICWPWDLDAFGELNNGRSLTLYDLGRFPLAIRSGLVGAMRRNGWSMTMAGVSVRWRIRIRAFERFEMRSKAVGWDDKFIYLDQSMWKRGNKCASQALYRAAVVGPSGIVPPSEVLAAMGHSSVQEALPVAVQAWIDAESNRLWPPEAGSA